jgi:DNA (cytosine-5)-methyltransferase 1
MKYGSVCSGIEAATQAWHHMGWKPSFFSEIDAFPCAVLQHHYPKVPLHGDFTTIQDGDYEPINLLVGGTPCQSFSVAGLRKGLDDPRGNLMLGFGALAKRLRPTWLVWENVPGVLSANGGRDFGAFLGMLAELGYGFAYRVLDAQFFGVAQRRKRVFVVGYLGDWRPAAAVLFERESLSGNPAPSREAEKDIAGTLTSSLGRRCGVPDGGDTPGQLQPVDAFRMTAFGEYSGDGTASTTKARDYKDATDLVVHGTQDPCTGSQAFALGRNNGAENAVFVSLRGREGGGTAELGGPIAGTIRASSGGGDKPHVMCFAQNTRDEVREMPYAGALAANPGMKQTSCARIGMAVRRLTPVECERLQGFPDNFTQIPYRNKTADKCPDGPRYKALGNSMAVPCMKWIGERIQQVQEITEKNAKEAAA